MYRNFPGHAGEVSKAVVSPDGLYVLSSSWKDHVIDVRLWNIAGGAQMQVFKFTGFIRSIGFSPDGKHLLIAHSQKTTGDAVKVLALDGREIKSYVDVGFSSYSNNGRYFLARDWREESGREQKLFEPATAPKKVGFHRDDFRKRSLVDIESGQVLGRFGQSGAVHVDWRVRQSEYRSHQKPQRFGYPPVESFHRERDQTVSCKIRPADARRQKNCRACRQNSANV